MSILITDLESINELAKTKAVAVRFTAPWCVPCRQFAPQWEMAAENSDSVFWAVVDIDQNPEIAKAFGVMSIPHAVFVGGDGQRVLTSRTWKQLLDEIG